jgi:hypothetical protein
MTIEETFVAGCRGTVYDQPCPSTFVSENRVVGNLYVQPDSVFGGGELFVGGETTDGDSFGMTLTGDEMTVRTRFVSSLYIYSVDWDERTKQKAKKQKMRSHSLSLLY